LSYSSEALGLQFFSDESFAIMSSRLKLAGFGNSLKLSSHLRLRAPWPAVQPKKGINHDDTNSAEGGVPGTNYLGMWQRW
jgi:hypothetical protein